MSTRRLWLVPAFLLLLPGEVMAHRHRTGFYIPRSWLRHSESTSWLGVSVALPMFKNHDWSAIAAFSRYSGTDKGEDFTLRIYTSGLRYTFPHDGLLPFLQVWGGGVDEAQKTDNASTDKSHRIAGIGGGFSIRLGGKHHGRQIRFRLQADGVRFERKTGFAYSVGFEVQLPEYKKFSDTP